MVSLVGQDPRTERRRRVGWHGVLAIIGVVLVVVGCGIVAGAFYLHEVSDEGSGQSDAARMLSGFISMGGLAVGMVGGVVLVLTLLAALVATVRGVRWLDRESGLVAAATRAGHDVERTWIQPGAWRRVPALRCGRCGSIWYGEGPTEVGRCADRVRDLEGVSGRPPARRSGRPEGRPWAVGHRPSVG